MAGLISEKRDGLAALYVETRERSCRLAAPLSAEDMQVQSMPDASPVKWHLAHTTWFFETFVLSPACDDYRPFDARFGYLFNSYYEAVGPRAVRSERGLVTRPSVDEVHDYRRQVDRWMETALRRGLSSEMDALVRLGLAHGLPPWGDPVSMFSSWAGLTPWLGWASARLQALARSPTARCFRCEG